MNLNLLNYCTVPVVNNARTLLGLGRLRRLTKEQAENGSTVLAARFVDHFNFVDKAQLKVDAAGERVLSASCSCPAFHNDGKLCSHCAAALIQWAADERTQSAEAPEDKPVSFAVANAPAVKHDAFDAGALPKAEAAPEITGISDDYPGYKFCNSQQDLYPGNPDPEIPLERFQYVYGKNFKANMLYSQYRQWSGSCYGMSSSASLFCQPGNDVHVSDFRKGAGRPVELSLHDRHRLWNITLHNYIEAMHITQMGPLISASRSRVFSTDGPTRLKDLCSLLEEAEANGTAPPVMDVWKNQRYDGGHSILPFHYEKIGRLRGRLHIYDPNVPGKVRYCDLRRDSAGNYISWRFLMYDNEEYSSDNGGMISFVPYKDAQAAWDRRATPGIGLFSTKCDDLRVQDGNGNDVIRIAAGKMTPLREDVIPVHLTDGDVGIDKNCFWIDLGTYHVINDDPDQDLSFEFAGENGSVEFETDADSADVTVNDAENILQVKLVEDNLSVPKRIWAFIKDVARQVLIRALADPIGSVLKLSLGVFTPLHLTAANVSEFKVDGQDEDITPYLTNAQEAPVQNEAEAFSEQDEEVFIANEAAKPGQTAGDADVDVPDLR